jgi:hypothetical protein
MAGEKGKSKSDSAIAKVKAVVLVILACVLIVAVIYFGSQALNFSGSPTVTPTPPPGSADLQVSNIEVTPVQPREQEVFQYHVWMLNTGESRSGSYDLNIDVLDTTHGQHYYKGPFRLGPVDPTSSNQAVLVYEGDCLPNDYGMYEIWAEIVPVDFEDGNEANNIFTSESFSVLSGAAVNP